MGLINHASRMFLDSSSGGSFTDNTVKEGENLIISLARNDNRNYEDNYERSEDTSNSDGKGLKEMNRKLELVLKSQSSRKEVNFVREPDQGNEFVDSEFDGDEEMHYVENGQNFQNRNYQNQGYNNNNSNLPIRSNFNGQGGCQFPRYNNFNQGNQRPFFPNNTSGPQQSRPYNENGGGFNRPSFQSGDQRKTSNYQGIELQKLERLETLIIKPMEEMSKSAFEQNKRIDAIGSNF